MASNYLIRGILSALPPGISPERHWRLLMALVTVTPGTDGWRYIGMRLLGEYACLSQPTLRRARDEVVTAGHVAYEATGRGRHARSRWLILIQERNPRVKDGVSPEDFSDEKKSVSGETPTALTSDNSALCFGALDDDDGGADRSAAAAALQGTYGWRYEHCLTVAGHLISNARNPLSDATSWVRAIVAKSPQRYQPGSFRPGGQARAKPTRKPPWCGKCDQQTRLREDDQGIPSRCPDCHPMAGAS